MGRSNFGSSEIGENPHRLLLLCRSNGFGELRLGLLFCFRCLIVQKEDKVVWFQLGLISMVYTYFIFIPKQKKLFIGWNVFCLEPCFEYKNEYFACPEKIIIIIFCTAKNMENSIRIQIKAGKQIFV